MSLIGKTLILLGITLIIIGAIFVLGVRIPWIGRLPGDIYVQKKTFSFYFPAATCILISVIATFIFFLIGRR